MADLEQLIREGFARGLEGQGPSDRWPEIAAALDPARHSPFRRSPFLRNRFRLAVRVAAACLALGAALGLLYPPLRAAAVDGIRTFLTVRWAGMVGDTRVSLLTEAGDVLPWTPWSASNCRTR